MQKHWSLFEKCLTQTTSCWIPISISIHWLYSWISNWGKNIWRLSGFKKSLDGLLLCETIKQIRRQTNSYKETILLIKNMENREDNKLHYLNKLLLYIYIELSFLNKHLLY